MKNKQIKIAYIGGGSRLWARTLMADLALEKELMGEVVLYDIDYQAALDNAVVGMLYQDQEASTKRFSYRAVKTIEEALIGADVVVISIMPATYEIMSAYVHLPEEYGVYQSVGDTTGVAQAIRGLICIPIFVEFAKKIQTYCPQAWVLNYTNPMTLCVQALYEGFPEIKAFGNCHEVFGTQELLKKVLQKELNLEGVRREEIKVDVIGIHHFTWFTSATFRDINLFPLFQAYVEKYGHPDYEEVKDKYKKNAPFGSEGKIKFDLFKKYGIIAAAGDRHLAEFFPMSHYLGSEELRDRYKFNLTPVSWRVNHLQDSVKKTAQLMNKERIPHLHPSGEEGLKQIKALLGGDPFLTNLNYPNRGQAPHLPLGQVVETNAYIRYQLLQPIQAKPLPKAVESMVTRHMDNQRLIMESYRAKDLRFARYALMNDPTCQHLSIPQINEMFDRLVALSKPYLEVYE